jgi:hypothetical protein
MADALGLDGAFYAAANSGIIGMRDVNKEGVYGTGKED